MYVFFIFLNMTLICLDINMSYFTYYYHKIDCEC
jgi:hypothetical protein